jgi:hypothetical protein
VRQPLQVLSTDDNQVEIEAISDLKSSNKRERNRTFLDDSGVLVSTK